MVGQATKTSGLGARMVGMPATESGGPRMRSSPSREASLGQLVPTEFRADLVVVLRDRAGVPVLAIVIEVQRKRDPAKRLSWPVYLAAARAKFGCPACVVVIAPRASVARWSAKPIDMGLGRAVVRPVVLGPNVVPRLDRSTASRHLELAVLSVIVHGGADSALETAQGAFMALASIDAPMQADYAYFILKSLRGSLRGTLR